MSTFKDFLREKEEVEDQVDTEEVENDDEGDDNDAIRPEAAKLEKIAAKFFNKKFDDDEAKEEARNAMLKDFSKIIDDLVED